ncbi:MAG: phosphoglucosamine mutase [Candidatus Micrarchaeia archaeon]
MVSFGTSGIRGVVGKEITPELALRLGEVVGKKKRVVIGRDTRESGVALEAALVAGVNFAGGDALKLGIVTTPTTAIATKQRGEIGVMITASHNPAEYNGFKVYNRFGEEISRAEEREIENIVGMARAEQSVSGGGVYEVKDAVEKHIELVLSLVDVGLIKRKKPKVVVDCGNGAASSVAPFLLKEAGCHVITVNAEPGGAFSRSLEPNSESLAEAATIVKRTGASLGVGYDGDGDRAVVIDEIGSVLGLDEQLSLLLSYIVSDGCTVVSTVEASLGVRETVERKGGKLVITGVGSRNVAEMIRISNAVFGGEPCGEYIFPEEINTPDGMMTTLKFIELVCKEGRLSRMRGKVKKYPVKRMKFECSDKTGSMEVIKDRLIEEFEGKLSERDGVRIDFKDGWLLVRASGTEPVIRLTCEHKNKGELERVCKKAEQIVREGLR